MASVLIVNDQPLQRLGLRMLLAAEPDLTVVGDTADAAEAVRLSAALRPDVVLMGGRRPRHEDVGTIRRIARPSHLTAVGRPAAAAAGPRRGCWS